MRGFVLAAAMILVSAGAQADESRNLVATLHHYGTYSAPRHQKLIAHGEAQTFDDAKAASEPAFAKTRPIVQGSKR